MLQEFFHKYPFLCIQCSESPITKGFFDVFVLPAAKYGPDNVFTYIPNFQNCIIIAYGNASYLKPSFLSGCTDFLKEPWQAEELYFRIMLHTRNYYGAFKWNSILFYPFYMQYNDTIVPLSKQEYIIIYTLVKNRGRIVSRSEFALSLWGKEKQFSRAVDMHISSLRKKIGGLQDTTAASIETIHGSGYLVL